MNCCILVPMVMNWAAKRHKMKANSAMIEWTIAIIVDAEGCAYCAGVWYNEGTKFKGNWLKASFPSYRYSPKVAKRLAYIAWATLKSLVHLGHMFTTWFCTVCVPISSCILSYVGNLIAPNVRTDCSDAIVSMMQFCIARCGVTVVN